MAMNNPASTSAVTDEDKLKVILVLSEGVMNRKDQYGNSTGGFKKMLNIYEIWDFAVQKGFEDITVAEITNILDNLIRMPGESPIKFFRRDIKGNSLIWYGLSKNGWLFVDRAGYEVPKDALIWANEPNVEPTPEQIAQNEANGGARLNRILEQAQSYNELMRERAKKEMTEVKEQTSASTEQPLPGLEAEHPANTGEGMPDPKKSGAFKDLFKTK